MYMCASNMQYAHTHEHKHSPQVCIQNVSYNLLFSTLVSLVFGDE